MDQLLFVPLTPTGSAEADSGPTLAAPPLSGDSVDLSESRIEAEIAGIERSVLSPNLLEWILEYNEVGPRPTYLWKWCRQAVELITLPCVAPELKDQVCDTKTLGVVFDVMLDDLADQQGNPDLLEELLNLPIGRANREFSQMTPEERAYGDFTCVLWDEIMRRARRLPHFREYADLLRYDYLQLCNVMRYSHLVNGSLDLLNLTEHDLYTPHNMHIMICTTFDLMCSPVFEREELGKLREIAWHAQMMGRCGNLMTTWERELDEQDFSSGVYARAVSQGDVTAEELCGADRESLAAIIREGGHEDFYLRRWNRLRSTLMSPRFRMRSFDTLELVANLERLLCLHLGSRGRK